MPPRVDQRRRPYTTHETRKCRHCARDFNVKGLTSHERACGARKVAAERDRAFEARLLVEARQNKRARIQEPDVREEAPHEELPHLDRFSVGPPEDDGLGPASGSNNNSELSEDDHHNSDDDNEECEPEIDDIKVVYHPFSEHVTKTVVHHFSNFNRERAALDVPPEEVPFRPFRCRADFEFGQLALDAALKAEHVDAIIKLIRTIVEGAEFTLTGAGDLANTWTEASKILTPFEKVDIKVPLLKEEREYEVWRRPLWDWTLDLLSDARLLPHFNWNAERLFKYDGNSFIRFIDEPYTADRFWNIQSKLGFGCSPFCWILYADRNKLSSFGTAKGWPVIARCANLPIHIRNGSGIGGGRVIGWLPVVKEDPAHTGNPTFVNHKRAVWHEAIRTMIESIEQYSKSGYCFTGADGVERVIFPCILILSADYEEQTYMTLNRGLGGYCPCPICLVPSDKQSDLTITAVLRTAKDSKKHYDDAQDKTFADAEADLKAVGLRNVFNAFWRVENSDPHEAASWDRLHSYSIGIFGDHMWTNFRSSFKHIGRSAQKKIDKQFSLLPRFKNLYHFDEVVNIYFNDGSKFESLAKQLLFAAHNVLTPKRSKHGYILLRCLRSFLILDTLLSFDVQTEDSIKAGENELQNFGYLISEYVKALPPKLTLPKAKKLKYTYSWDFIKMHYQKHAFADVKAKGATRNYNTKPNEQLHKPMRDAYHRRTNFKNVAQQILTVEHQFLVSSVIKSKIDDLDKKVALESQEEDVELSLPRDHGHIHIGSPRPKVTFADFEKSHSDDPAYRNFRKNLADHLSDFLPAHSIALPNGKRISINANDTLTEYCYVKVNYENLVNWKESTDYLRCSPKFHGRPRYDAIIFRTVRGPIFGHLVTIVDYKIEGKSYPTALIQPCDAPVGRLYRKDVDLRLTRVRAKPRQASEFISVETIIRGAVLVQDHDKYGEYLVMDVLDADMFLRIRKMQNHDYM